MNIQKPYDVGKASYNTIPKPATQETQKKSTTLAADNVDKFEESSATYKATYNKNTNKAENRKVDNDEFSSKAASSARQIKNDAVRTMVQAQISGQVNKGGYKPLFGGNPTVMDALKKAEATSEKYDDYWGVEATADRIFTFAKSLAGDDDGMFQKMKDAFLKGFKAAEGARGGSLPSISYQTKSKVLEKFDAWEKEINAKKNASPTDDKKEADAKKASTSSSSSSSKTIPFVGAGKYGTTPAPTTFSKGNKIPYIGDEKYGASIRDDFDVNGFVVPEKKD